MLFIVQFATILFLVHLATAMQIKFFLYPNCIQQMYTSYAFSDVCTSGQPLGNAYDLALTTCDVDKTGNGTITATYFNHGYPSGRYSPPTCNNTIQANLTSTGWGVCMPLTEFIGSLAVSFMFGDESEEIQCSSSQGAFLYSARDRATVCAALQYTIVDSIPLTGRNGCFGSPFDGQHIRAFYLNKKQKEVSLTYYNDNECSNTSIAYSFPSMPLDGSCVISTGGNLNYISGALPVNPYPPVQTN